MFKATKINFAKIFVQWIIKTAKYFLQWANKPAKIITVRNISAFSAVLKHCQRLFINQHFSNRTHHNPMRLYTHGPSNTTASFEYISTVLVVCFMWQCTSCLLRLMLIFLYYENFCTRKFPGLRYTPRPPSGGMLMQALYVHIFFNLPPLILYKTLHNWSYTLWFFVIRYNRNTLFHWQWRLAFSLLSLCAVAKGHLLLLQSLYCFCYCSQLRPSGRESMNRTRPKRRSVRRKRNE